jgi:hypothetical protein
VFGMWLVARARDLQSQSSRRSHHDHDSSSPCLPTNSRSSLAVSATSHAETLEVLPVTKLLKGTARNLPFLGIPQTRTASAGQTSRPRIILDFEASALAFRKGSCLPLYAASPVDETREILPPHAPPAGTPSSSSLNDGEPGGASSHPWGDFGSRITFDFAEHHFVELQSSAKGIARGLDLWAAQALRAKEEARWASPEAMYDTIDAIQLGDVAWSTDHFYYTGPRPDGASPQWMDTTYELCRRDVRKVIHQQLASPEFKDQSEYRPYMQFNGRGRRVYSNVMSGSRAWMRAVSSLLINPTYDSKLIQARAIDRHTSR